MIPRCSTALCLLMLTAPSLRAGSIETLSGMPEMNGKLTLTATGVQVDSSNSEVPFSQILEANFAPNGFHIDVFTLDKSATRLPDTWKTQDVGTVSAPGTVKVANGELTLTGGGSGNKNGKGNDAYFFLGCPWPGDGQWTVQVKSFDSDKSSTAAGLMMRDGLDGDSSELNIALSAMNKARQFLGPTAVFQADAGLTGKHNRLERKPVNIQIPTWARITLNGLSVTASLSSDGQNWDVLAQHSLRYWRTPTWIGLYLNSRDDQATGSAVFGNLSFEPAPSIAQTIPPGVVLTSGSFIAGAFDGLVLASDNGAEPPGKGTFRRNGNGISIPTEAIADVIMQPTGRSQITDAGAQIGLVMKNGDFLEGTPQSISANAIKTSSLVLGPATYTTEEVRACLLKPAAPSTASYEVRLTDGSCVHSSSVGVAAGKLTLTDATGVSIVITPDEVAQFRVGPAAAVNLLELPWKPGAPAASAAPNAPAPPPLACWSGNEEEQILALPGGLPVNFPMPGTVHALALRISVSPDSPPNAQVVVAVLADGRELGRTQPFRAGDQPRFVQLTLPPGFKTLTIQADSPYAGTRVLLIDPILLK
jgi:hypothetical protein